MAEKISEIILYSLAGSVIIFVLILTLIFIVAAIIQNIVGVFGVRGESEDDSREKSSPKIIYFLSATVLAIPAVLKYFSYLGRGKFPWQKKFLKLFCTHLQDW